MRADTVPLDASEPAAAFDPSDVLESLGESLAPTLPAAPGGASAEPTFGTDSAAAATEPSDGLASLEPAWHTESASPATSPTITIAATEQSWLTNRLVHEAPDLLRGGDLNRHVELTKGGRRFAAELTRQPAGTDTGVERVRVEIETERNGVRLRTSMLMKRLSFSHFTQLIDFWDPSVELHDDQIAGRFHSNSEIVLTYDRKVAPRLLGMVTTANGIRVADEKGARSHQEIFAGGLETHSARIRLPRLDLPFGQRDTRNADVHRVQEDTLIVFHADGSYDCTDLGSQANSQRHLTPGRPTYIVGEREVELRVRGIVNGSVTVYSPERIVIQGDLTYAQDAGGGDNPSFLGLVSDGAIEVDRAEVTGPGNLEIDAAIYARKRFAVRNAAARERAMLVIHGSLTAGSVSETEPRYATRIEFDPRFEQVRPPGFPETDRYELESWDGRWQVADSSSE